jgi:hypothetical protein
MLTHKSIPCAIALGLAHMDVIGICVLEGLNQAIKSLIGSHYRESGKRMKARNANINFIIAFNRLKLIKLDCSWGILAHSQPEFVLVALSVLAFPGVALI